MAFRTTADLRAPRPFASFRPAARKITIMATGGAWQAALRKAWFEPFTKETGITFDEQEYTGDLGKIKAMVDTGDVRSISSLWRPRLFCRAATKTF